MKRVTVRLAPRHYSPKGKIVTVLANDVQTALDHVRWSFALGMNDKLEIISQHTFTGMIVPTKKGDTNEQAA